MFLKKLQKNILFFHLICHNVKIHRFVVSGDYPREINEQ